MTEQVFERLCAPAPAADVCLLIAATPAAFVLNLSEREDECATIEREIIGTKLRLVAGWYFARPLFVVEDAHIVKDVCVVVQVIVLAVVAHPLGYSYEGSGDLSHALFGDPAHDFVVEVVIVVDLDF
jgi:hypothetical protein